VKLWTQFLERLLLAQARKEHGHAQCDVRYRTSGRMASCDPHQESSKKHMKSSDIKKYSAAPRRSGQITILSIAGDQ